MTAHRPPNQIPNSHVPIPGPAPDSTRHKAKSVEWDDAKGFGFLLHRKRRLFLHRRDFAERHKRPALGDLVHFRVGQDTRGRRCAVEAVHHNDGGRLTLFAWVLVAGLLVLPGLAVARLLPMLPRPAWSVGAWLTLINSLTYALYHDDKHRARTKKWRIAESTLHLCELLGGWPAAYLAQRQLRHKCSKGRYQAVFFFIIALYQLLSLDFLRGWQTTKTILECCQAYLEKLPH